MSQGSHAQAGRQPAGVRRALGWLVTPPQFPPFRPGTFRSRVHDPAPASWLGMALGLAFGVCFVTGMVSHLIQSGGSLLDHDVVSGGGWRAWATVGGQLYRVTQGLHVIAGIAAVPLLFAKLFVVYPLLFTWPPVRGVRHAVERITLPVLVGGSIVMLLTGVQNVMYWYPWGFFFPVGHYWAAWGTIGGRLAHIGAKASTAAAVARRGLPTDTDVAATADVDGAEAGDTLPADGGPMRRTVLTATAAVSGLVVAASAGGTVRPLARLAVLNARSPGTGPQGFPVNTAAAAARVTQAAMSPNYRLQVSGGAGRAAAADTRRPAGAPPARGGPAHRVRRGLVGGSAVDRGQRRDPAGAGRRRPGCRRPGAVAAVGAVSTAPAT